MEPTILWVVGEPGIGKTTLVRRLIEPDSYFVPRPKWTVGLSVCAAGHYYGETFDGGDTVPYNGVAEALNFWREQLHTKALTIFDGDRFSSAPTLEFFKVLGRRVRCAFISCKTPEIATMRREKRTISKQNETWVKGRRSKSLNFATQKFAPGEVLTLDGEQPVEKSEEEVRAWLVG